MSDKLTLNLGLRYQAETALTEKFHKGGPAVGVFLQLVAAAHPELPIPGRPFTFGQLIRAQADGDASVLAELGRPVLSLALTEVDAGIQRVIDAAS